MFNFFLTKIDKTPRTEKICIFLQFQGSPGNRYFID